MKRYRRKISKLFRCDVADLTNIRKYTTWSNPMCGREQSAAVRSELRN